MANSMKRTRKWPAAVLGAAALMGAPALAAAQSMTINLGAGLGTGLEVGRGAAVVARHSPTFVAVHAGLLLDNDQRFELGLGLLLELEGRVGVALEPQLRLRLPSTRRVSGYAMAGLPLFLSPYTLYGVSVGPGVLVKLWGPLHGYAEVLFRCYPFGNDLPESGMLFHLDGVVGVRHAF